MHKLILGFTVLAFSLTGWAQRGGNSDSAGEVYLGYSLLNGDTLSNASGFEAALMGKTSDWLGWKADLTGNYKSAGGAHAREYNIVFGPQVNRRMDRINFFAHGLFGAAHFSSDVGPSSTSLAWVLGGGGDYSLTDRFAWRVAQLDYHGGHVFSTTQTDFRFSTGLVLRF
jgi:hypothetical protein